MESLAVVGLMTLRIARLDTASSDTNTDDAHSSSL